ncbi:p53 and DNA damage-regulated protein 1-like [Tubulanus polymorphus]|uniref:p53 and DNA damage-regulated protein 1-like n=1 Tax=Tubulanus polymorphus TaxID=672921 RepID=UPI003DA5E9E3
MAGTNTDSVLNYLTQIEELAEDILVDKERLIDLDRRRQKTREATRAFRKDKSNDKQWICMGNMFFKFPKRDVSKMLDEDITELEKAIDNVNKGLKTKMEKLHGAEERESPRGFSLNPLTRKEMIAVKKCL